MKPSPVIDWPPLEAGYIDEFGTIEAEVYLAAGMIWRQEEHCARAHLHDSQAGHRLLLRAAAAVSIKHQAPDQEIENLKSYLFQALKRLILDELRKANRRKELHSERAAELEP